MHRNIRRQTNTSGLPPSSFEDGAPRLVNLLHRVQQFNEAGIEAGGGSLPNRRDVGADVFEVFEDVLEIAEVLPAVARGGHDGGGGLRVLYEVLYYPRGEVRDILQTVEQALRDAYRLDLTAHQPRHNARRYYTSGKSCRRPNTNAV